MKGNRRKNLLFSVFAVAVLWLAWVLAYFAVGNDYLLPSFSETMRTAGGLLAERTFWNSFLNTLLRTLLSFAVSLAAGVGFALLARLFASVRAFFAPVISLLRTVPTMAFILVLLLWTSPSFAPIIVTLLVLFPAVYAMALSAFDETYSEFGPLVLSYGVSKPRQALKMYLPLGASSLLSQSGSVLSMGLKITVSGEVLSSAYRSLGWLMQNAKMNVDMPRLLALTLVTVLAGFVLEGICALAAKGARRRLS